VVSIMLKNDCIFCKIIKGEIPCKKVFENNDILAFNDIKPQAPIHVILIPKIHIEKISDINQSNSDITGKLVLAANKIALDLGINEKGYRLVFNCGRDSGQEVFHIHLHLLGGRSFHWPPG